MKNLIRYLVLAVILMGATFTSTFAQTLQDSNIVFQTNTFWIKTPQSDPENRLWLDYFNNSAVIALPGSVRSSARRFSDVPNVARPLYIYRFAIDNGVSDFNPDPPMYRYGFRANDCSEDSGSANVCMMGYWEAVEGGLRPAPTDAQPSPPVFSALPNDEFGIEWAGGHAGAATFHYYKNDNLVFTTTTPAAIPESKDWTFSLVTIFNPDTVVRSIQHTAEIQYAQ